MKAVCAWCKKDLGPRNSPPGAPDTITHGICEACASRLFSEFSTPLKLYLDGLAIPVLVMDGTGFIRSGNRQAGQLLNRKLAELINTPCGTAFACMHASLAEGCGHTSFCSDCAIRNAIVRTHETGTSLIRLPATVQTAADGSGIRLLFSTQKVSDCVLLRIDALEENIPPRGDA